MTSMLDPRTEAVLHAAAFGDLVDRTALDRLLAEDVEARERFEQLQRLAGDLRAMGAVDAPADLKGHVMRDVAARPMTPTVGASAAPGMRTGETMSKKLILGIAATIAAALGLYAALGGSVPPQGAEGTIGAAKRYQGQQMSASDVTLGDQALQSFLQSPAFDKLRRDPAARATFQKVVTNANFAELMKSAYLSQLLSDAQLSKVAFNAELRQLLSNAELARLAARPEAQALSDAELRHAIADAEFAKLISDAELRQLVTDADFGKLANDAEFKALLSSAAFAELVSDASFKQLVTDADFKSLLSSAAFAQLMTDASFKQLVNDAEFSKMSADAFMSAVDTGLTAGRKSGKGQQDTF